MNASRIVNAWKNGGKPKHKIGSPLSVLPNKLKWSVLLLAQSDETPEKKATSE